MLSLINPSISSCHGSRDETNPHPNRFRVILFLCTAIAVLITGVTNLILLGWGTRQVVARCEDQTIDECKPANFNSPFTQQLAHSSAQALGLVIHLLDRLFSRYFLKKSPRFEFRSEIDGYLRDRPSPLLWALPAIFDFGEGILVLFANSLINKNVVQVIRNFNIALTASFAGCFLGVSLRIYHWLGIILLTAGCTIIGLDGHSISSKRSNVMGIFLALMGTAMTSFLLVYEESVFRIYRASPFAAIGWIGFFEFWLTLCAFGIAHATGVEHIDVIWYQLGQSAQLRWSLLLFMLSIIIMNVCATCTTKLGGAVVTVILYATRQAPYWLTQVCIGWMDFNWVPLIGLALIILAFIVHTKVLHCIKCFPFVTHIMEKVWICRCRCFLSDPDLFADEDLHVSRSDVKSGLRPLSRITSMEELSDLDDLDGGDLPLESMDSRTVARLPPHAQHSIMIAKGDSVSALSGTDIPMPTRAYLEAKRSKSTVKSKSVYAQDSGSWIYVEREAEWLEEGHGLSM